MSHVLYSLRALGKHYEKPGKLDFFQLFVPHISDVQEINLLGKTSQSLCLPAYVPPD